MSTPDANELPALAAWLATTALIDCQRASAASPTMMGEGTDTSKIRGSKPVSVALVHGYGGDARLKTALAQLQDQVSKCLLIKKVVYSDAGCDQ